MAKKLRKTVLALSIFGLSTAILAVVMIINNGMSYIILITLPIIFSNSALIALNIMTRYYPLNNPSDYKFNLKHLMFRQDRDSITLDAREACKGLWIVIVEEQMLIFDLRGQFFPKNYIAAFFVRQFNFSVVNKRKLGIMAIASNLKIDDNNISRNISIQFYGIKKHCTIKIVKNGRTRALGIKQFLILGHYPGLWYTAGSPGARKDSLEYQKVSEELLQKKFMRINQAKTFSYKEELALSEDSSYESILQHITQIYNDNNAS